MTKWALTQRASSQFFIALPIVFGFFRRRQVGWHAQQLPAARQFLFSIAIAQEAVIADALEPIRQDVQEETADELVRIQRHRLLLALMTIILVAECDLAVIDVQQAIIGDRHAMCVTADVVQNLLGSGKRALGVDHPFGSSSYGQVS